MSSLDYSQVDKLVLMDYEGTDRTLDLSIVENLVFLEVNNSKSIGVNLDSLYKALQYLKEDNVVLHERLNLPYYNDKVYDPTVYRKAPAKGRPSWDDYAITLARAAATRSEDPYIKVGCVTLRPDHSVASLGYNGAPSGVDMDWTDRDERRKRVLHAEANALRYVRPGELTGGMLATTMLPCLECLKAARAQGVTDILYENDIPDHYNSDDIFKIAAEFGVDLRKYNA